MALRSNARDHASSMPSWRRRWLSSIAPGSAIALGLTVPGAASAQFEVTDPVLEGTQLQTNAQSLVNQAKDLVHDANSELNQINAYVQQIQQYENQIQNTITLPAQLLAQVQGVINHAVAVVNNVELTYQRAEGIAVTLANIDKQFTLRFPGFAPIGGPVIPGGVPSASASQAQMIYSQRLNGTLSSIQGAIAATGMAAQDLMNTEPTTIAQLAAMAQNSSGGAVQALQNVQSIMLHQAGQMNTLQSLIQAQVQSETNFHANSVQNDADNAALMALFAHPVTGAY
jgi:P-type conjugative transfer protein TrbJ